MKAFLMKPYLIRIIFYIKSNILEVSVISFFILDTVNFIIDQQIGLNTFNSVSVYGKVAVETIAILTLLKRKVYKKELILTGILTVIPVIVYFIHCMKIGVFEKEVFYIVAKEGNKYVFAIVLFLWIKTINVNWKKLQPLFETVFIFSSLTVLTAFIFNLEYFYTYNETRFGFKPALATQNEITYFWMIGVTYFGQKYFSHKNAINLVKIILVLFTSSLLGTKAILLFIICYSFFSLVFQTQLSLSKITLVSIVLLVLLGLFIYVSGLFSFFFEIYENNGLLYAITSMRIIYIKEHVIPLINHFEFWNFFIGGHYIKIPLTEMDLIDAFFFLGLIGVSLYFYLLRRTMFSLSISNKTGLFFVSQYFLIGGLAGHIFTSGINAIYVAILVIYLQNNSLKSSEL